MPGVVCSSDSWRTRCRRQSPGQESVHGPGWARKAPIAVGTVYVRDDRPSGGGAAPAVWFQYSPNRQGEHPQRHLKAFHGVLQADAFSGYNALYDEREGGPIIEAGCWSHVRRKAWDIHERQKQVSGTLAHQALVRMSEIFKSRPRSTASRPTSEGGCDSC